MRGDNTAKAVEIEALEPEIRRPIDMDHLSRQTLGDPGLELEVLRMFDAMSHTYYARLENSTNVEDLLRNLHTLKGAAAGIGAFGLAELARVAETELRDGAPVNPERIDDLGVAVEEVSTFIGDRIRVAEAA
jgi:HPt (histidine-containing phosphotransfer) domain-containing protein